MRNYRIITSLSFSIMILSVSFFSSCHRSSLSQEEMQVSKKKRSDAFFERDQLSLKPTSKEDGISFTAPSSKSSKQDLSQEKKKQLVKGEKKLTLFDALEIALSDNPLIARALEHQREAQNEKWAALADFLPNFSFSYFYEHLDKVPVRNFGGFSALVNYQHSHEWQVGFSQPLFTGFATLSKYQMAKLGVEIQQVEKDLVEIDLITNVKVAFYRALQAKKLKMASEDNYQGLASHEKDTAHFYENSVLPKNDLLKSQVATANAEQRKNRATADVKSSLYYLASLLAIEKGVTFDVDETDVFSFYEELPSMEDLLQKAESNRPEVKALKLAIKNLDHQITLAQSPYYPQVFLHGHYEERGKGVLEKEYIYTERFNTIFNLEFKWEFFHFGKTRAESLKKIHEKKAIENELKNVINEVEFQVKNALLDLDVARKNIDTAKTALTQAEEHWRITNLQFQQQLATTTDVIDAGAFLTEAKGNYYVAYYGYKIALAQLERACGNKLGEL